MLQLHPEQEELHQRYASLRKRLRSISQEWYNLQHDEKPVLLQKYAILFGGLERELQTATLEAANLQRRAELFTMRLQRGQSLNSETIKLLHEIVDKEFAVYNKQEQKSNEQSADTMNAANQPSSITTGAEQSNEEVSSLYKSIVKKLHPDIHGETDDYKAFWHIIQEAYSLRNLQQLRSIHSVLGIEETIVVQTTSLGQSLDDMRRAVYLLEMRVDYEQRKLARLQNDEPFTLRENMENPEWCAAHRQSIEQQIRKQKRMGEVARTQLVEILGTTWEEFYKAHAEVRETFDFNDDFLQNTYFSGRM